ncbi:transcription elongation factor GreA [Veillonella sp. DNF00869]|nr:transcription elongation factor GreA [Veillonella sp. DNF00869]
MRNRNGETYMAEVKETLLTAEGLKKLEEELNYYKSVRRIEVAERIKIAISYGDISENSEYDDAKNEQAFIEGHIIELENKINTAKIIDENVKGDTVTVGSKVTLLDEEFNEELDYTIVGSSEADPFNNRISNESPVGVAILGKAKGDKVEVNTPDGMVSFKILSIQ